MNINNQDLAALFREGWDLVIVKESERDSEKINNYIKKLENQFGEFLAEQIWNKLDYSSEIIIRALTKYTELIERARKDKLFRDFLPDETTIEYIEKFANRGYKLVATCATDDPKALSIHEEIEARPGIFHYYQLNATRSGSPVGINLYFIKQEESHV